MRHNHTKTLVVSLAALAALSILPGAAQAQSSRQKTKNDWRNLTIAGGGAALYGLLKHDPTITFLGAAGALYSANRYEQDRKSQSESARARASLFDRKYFERDGHRYERRETVKNGHKYYYFARRDW